jgi:anti-sigma factor RsiW
LGCRELGDLVHAYADGELDVVRSAEMERHLPGCAACTRTLRDLQALRSSLRTDGLYAPAPARLRRRARSLLRRAGRARRSVPVLRWASAGAALAVAASLAWILVGIPRIDGPADDPIIEEIISSHLRSLEPGHLTDVASSDQHTVKPWFAGRVDFSPPVTDLAGSGFPLLGARVDYLEGRRVAALVYGRNKHVINVLVRPASGEPDQPLLRHAALGYNVLRWTHSGMAYAVVSDLNESELLALARELQKPPDAPSTHP